MQLKQEKNKEIKLQIYNPSVEELKKNYIQKGLKGLLFLNMLMLPATFTTLTFFVFISRYRVVYELLTPLEKIKYIVIYGSKLSLFASLVVLPPFLLMNNKILMTYKYNF